MVKKELSLVRFGPSVLFLVLVKIIVIAKSDTTSDSGSSNLPSLSLSEPSDSYCVYDGNDVEENPWTATLQVHVGDGKNDYYALAILDAYTLATYGRPFHDKTDKLSFLPWPNYTVLINAEKNGTLVISSQTIQVSHIQPHPTYSRRMNIKTLWMFTEDDYIVIHLRTPIYLSPSVRPVCLPRITSTDYPSMYDELAQIYSENKTVIVGGWKKYRDLEKTSMQVKLGSEEECETEWRDRTRLEPNELPYHNRVCGYVTQVHQDNPDSICIEKDSAVVVRQGNHYVFLGFVNLVTGHLGLCSNKAFLFIIKLSPVTLKWLNSSMSCGSNQYTCHNGQCAPLSSVCNQVKGDGCSDHSDEDPKYCRALRPCKQEEFECGVYGACIPKISNGKVAQNCNGVKDCPLGEDEEFCDEIGGIPPRKLISGVAIGFAVLVILLIPAAVLIWRRVKQNRGWKLTDDDVKEFDFGCEMEEGISSEVDKAYCKPFDSEKYEIPLDKIAKYQWIGSGHFADVYLGVLKDFRKSDSMTCAIKAPKSNADPEQIKCFLKELKILAMVGEHKHVASFIGAYTRGLKEGILYIIVEYCEIGCLQDFLKRNRESFNNQLKTCTSEQVTLGNVGYVQVDVRTFSTTDLIRWATEIASGMAHLADKNVIHGDLSTRNLLVDGNLAVKICDFGLSHHLYTEITYVASADSRLPWRWMAPEVLLERRLSTKSDVWSYSVTLWEMFSLGGEPYEDQVLEWSPSFAYSLSTTGCPLQQPQFATDDIFLVMQDCWALEPSSRPDFNQIERRIFSMRII